MRPHNYGCSTSYKLMTQGQYPRAVAWLEKMIRENE